jgi:hypothetical protein
MRLMKVLMAVLLLAAMAVPAIAEDRLQLSGEMRVRAFYVDTDNDWDAPGDDSTDTLANQRLRIAGKIAVAEGVSVTFRTDITEGTNWGDHSSFGGGPGNPERSNGFGSGRGGSQQQWDRAHMDIVKNGMHLRAGQLYFGTGGTFALDTQDNGLVFDFNPGVKVEAFFIQDRDNNTAKGYYLDPKTGVAFNPTSENEHDGFLSGLGVSPKGDNWSAKLYLANQNSVLNQDENVYAGIASVNLKLDAINLFAELDYFDGDYNDTVDAFGTQLFLDASMAATDAVKVGAQFYYAMGDDEDYQYVILGNGFNGWDPVFDVGTSLSNEEVVLGNPFNFSSQFVSLNLGAPINTSAGVIGGRLYSSFKVSDALTLGASAAYLTVEEDAIVDMDVVLLAGGLVYTILPNTTFQVQAQYADGSIDSILDVNVSDGDFDAVKVGTGLFVTF